MDFKDQVTKWVEDKIGRVISKDLREKIVDENSSFDVETYANILLEKHFSENNAEQLKEILNQDSYDDLIYSEFEYFTLNRDSPNDSLELDSNECQTFLEEEIIKDLESNSAEVKKKSLRILEAATEDVINQTSWNVIFDGLQKTFTTTSDREIHNLVLKIFQKLLKCSKKSQAVCNGFTGTAKLLATQIVFFNLEKERISLSQTQGLEEGKWQCKNNLASNIQKHRDPKSRHSACPEVLLKLMWLLVDCQQQMPVKWTRFNEARFREIIFSFVHLLSSTTVLENKKLSGLELLSVLNPTASWCHYYCHTAVGRSLLCSALKKYKSFFTHVVEIILNRIKIRKSARLPSLGCRVISKETPREFKNASEPLRPFNKTANIGCETGNRREGLKQKRLERHNWIRSAPVEQSGINKCQDGKTKRSKTSGSDWLIKGIPRGVVTEAVFCHSVFFVTCLIQFRSGRALFPLYMKIRKRLLSIQDLSLYLMEYLEKTEDYERDGSGINFTPNYKAKLLEIVDILRSVKTRINSSRTTERQGFSCP